MNKKNITISALAAVLVLSMAAMAVAGPGYGRGGCGGPGYGANSAYGQLTPEKQAAVDSIYEKHRVKFDELRTQMWTKHSTLQALINGGNADEKRIAKLTADITKLRDQMRDTREAMRIDLEKETGIVAGNGFASCPAYGQASCPGYGQGRGQGRGMGPGMMY